MNTPSMHLPRVIAVMAENVLPRVLGRYLGANNATNLRKRNGAADLPQVLSATLHPIGSVVHQNRAQRFLSSSYWVDAGWARRDDNHLIGHYRARNRRFRGSIKFMASKIEPYRFYLYDPPARLLQGPHGPCYRQETTAGGLTRYFVHFEDAPADIDSGIRTIETNLVEALH